MSSSSDSPIVRDTPRGADTDSYSDVKFEGEPTSVDLGTVPPIFLPRGGPFALIDCEKVHAVHPGVDIFDERGIDRGGVVMVVRPDHYVAQVLPWGQLQNSQPSSRT